MLWCSCMAIGSCPGDKQLEQPLVPIVRDENDIDNVQLTRPQEEVGPLPTTGRVTRNTGMTLL